MRLIFSATLICVAMFRLTACAQIPPTHTEAKVANAPAVAGLAINDVLDELHASGQNVHSFSADVKRQEFDDVTGAEVDRTGKVWFENQPNGDVIFHVYFDHTQIGKHLGNEKVEYQIEGGWLTILDYTKKHVNRDQMNLPGQKVNLFQLGEGQFPLPIGQDKKAVRNLFDVSKANPDKDDPVNTVHLKLVPKPRTQFADSFEVIEVWVDQATHMPVRIATTNAKKSQDTVNDLLNMKINPTLTREELSVPAWDKTWNYTETALPQ